MQVYVFFSNLFAFFEVLKKFETITMYSELMNKLTNQSAPFPWYITVIIHCKLSDNVLLLNKSKQLNIVYSLHVLLVIKKKLLLKIK